MTRRAKATVMQWLDDVIPGRSERKMPPRMGDKESQDALRSFPGQCLIAWLALEPHGFSYSAACDVVPRSPRDDDNEKKWLEFVRLNDVYLSRRRTIGEVKNGIDWSETWLQEDEAKFAAEYGLKELGDLTLDQYEWLCSGGKADEGTQYDLEAIQRNFEANVLPRIKAALADGTMEAMPSTR